MRSRGLSHFPGCAERGVPSPSVLGKCPTYPLTLQRSSAGGTTARNFATWDEGVLPGWTSQLTRHDAKSIHDQLGQTTDSLNAARLIGFCRYRVALDHIVAAAEPATGGSTRGGFEGLVDSQNVDVRLGFAPFRRIEHVGEPTCRVSPEAAKRGVGAHVVDQGPEGRSMLAPGVDPE